MIAIRRQRPPAWALLLCLPLALLAACGGGAGAKTAASAPAGAAPARLLLAPEDVVLLAADEGTGGPVVTGSIQPQRRADLRAEVGSLVVAVARENGEAVRRGELLVRLDDTAIRDSLTSALAAERSAAQSLEQAERQLQRLQTLRASGMTTAAQFEDAENRRNTSQSDLAAARARVVQARQQLARTEVRAPFDGLVAERKASVGDTAAPGKELVKVVDPRSLRLEGVVSADAIESVRPGQAVRFRVNGFPGREFEGKVRLVSPTANPVTRQVEVLIDVPADLPARMAGLYAEGRVQAASQAAGPLWLPASALVRDADGRAFAWRLEAAPGAAAPVPAGAGVLRKRPVELGPRDPRRGDWPVRAGLAAGDRVLRHPNDALREGQAFEPTASAGVAPAASVAAAGADPARAALR